MLFLSLLLLLLLLMQVLLFDFLLSYLSGVTSFYEYIKRRKELLWITAGFYRPKHWHQNTIILTYLFHII